MDDGLDESTLLAVSVICVISLCEEGSEVTGVWYIDCKVGKLIEGIRLLRVV